MVMALISGALLWAAFALIVVSSIVTINDAQLQQHVSPSLIVQQIQELANASGAPKPSVTRIVFSKEDIEGRNYIKQLMQDAGLEIREDEMGNIFGRLQGSDDSAGAVLSGSHADAIPLSGSYDGTYGVLGAIMALKTLKALGFQARRSLEAVMFTSEEPTRFGISCIGSRAMAGRLDSSRLHSALDSEGMNFMQAAAAAGYAASGDAESVIASAQAVAQRADFFVELHIEQGPQLEMRGLQLGIVTGIAAPAALRVSFHGDGGHAGSQVMHLRNDASLAAAELALELETYIRALETEDAVGTVGRWDVRPNAVNSVPKEAFLEVDIRDVLEHRRDGIVAYLLSSAASISKRRKVRWESEVITSDPPAVCSATVQEALASAAARVAPGGTRHMISRAYHDSLFMAQFVPTGMLFIPCFKGYSHRPDEFASGDDMATGIRALALAMAELANYSPSVENKLNAERDEL